MNHLGTKTLEAPRLILRQFRPSDAQDMFNNWCNSPAVCKYLSWDPHRELETTRKVLSGWVEAYQDNTVYHWVIELKENNQAIGSIGALNVSEKHLECFLGYCIGEAFWGQGLMTEAVARVITFLFEEVGLHRIEARHLTKNPASGRVMEKCGMVWEGTLRRNRLMKDGTYGDMNIWAILREDWERDKLRT